MVGPLWMPPGSVRALLAFAILAIFWGTIWWDVPDQYFTATAALAGSVLTHYFQARKQEGD